MMRVYGRLRVKATEAIEVEATTIEDAKAAVLAQLAADVD
ncbi:hypothetical protein GCM10027415_37770 [Humibacter ginsengisoli]